MWISRCTCEKSKLYLTCTLSFSNDTREFRLGESVMVATPSVTSMESHLCPSSSLVLAFSPALSRSFTLLAPVVRCCRDTLRFCSLKPKLFLENLPHVTFAFLDNNQEAVGCLVLMFSIQLLVFLLFNYIYPGETIMC